MILDDMLFQVVLFIVLINIFAFTLMWIDKQRSIKGKWRISENNLMLTACLGGALGMLVALKLFRHKTKKRLFNVGLPLLVFVHLGIILYSVY